MPRARSAEDRDGFFVGGFSSNATYVVAIDSTDRRLQVKYKEKNIAECLNMSVQEAAEFFENFDKIFRTLDCLRRVGLGYISLGQPSTTLSGGESQESSWPRIGQSRYRPYLLCAGRANDRFAFRRYSAIAGCSSGIGRQGKHRFGDRAQFGCDQVL